MYKLLISIHMTLILPFSIKAGVVGGGNSIMAIDSDQMLILEKNLAEINFIRINSIDTPVKSLQDFQTSSGKRGIVVETAEGVPIILMERELDHSESLVEE